MADLIHSVQFYLSKYGKDSRPVDAYLYPYLFDFVFNHSLYRRLNLAGESCLHLIYGLKGFPQIISFNNNAGIPLDKFAEETRNYFCYDAGFPDFEIGEQIGNQWATRKILAFPLNLTREKAIVNRDNPILCIEIRNHPEIAELGYTPGFMGGFSYVASHFTIETMMATHLIECLEVPVVDGFYGESPTGRYFYELLWMMKKKIQPLGIKLASEGKRPYTIQTAMLLLLDRINMLDVNLFRSDLGSFFSNEKQIDQYLSSFQRSFSTAAEFYFQ